MGGDRFVLKKRGLTNPARLYIHRSMGAELEYRTFPLPPGSESTRFTVKKMVELVRAGIKSPAVRLKALKILQASAVPEKNQRAEVAAIFRWVKDSIRFTKDPTLVELVHTPEKLLELRAGDCDDFTVLIAALLGAVGYDTRVAIVGPVPGVWSHTFPEVWLGGKWVPLDATAERDLVERARKSGNYKTFALIGGRAMGALEVKPTVAVNGAELYTEIVRQTISYVNGELNAGRMKPVELARYFSVIPADKSLTPLMKAATLKGVELVAAHRFGYSVERLKQMSRLAGPGDLGFLGGIFKGIKKAVGGVVGMAKNALGIPSGQPVAVKVELPPGTSPRPIEVVPGVTAQVVPPSPLESVAEGAKNFFSSGTGLVVIGLGVGALAWFMGRRRGRRGR